MEEGRSGTVDFSGLVAGLAASAMAILTQIDRLLQPGDAAAPADSPADESKPPSGSELEKRVRDGLSGARQLIDTLAVLEGKTKGNLTADEEELLRSTLSELRISYVALANKPIPGSGEPQGEAR